MEFEFEWDPEKAEANLQKHGVSFPYATRAFLDVNRQERLDEFADEEERWVVSARVDEFVLVVVYTFRGTSIRMISSRRATRREFEEYWNGQIPT
jgi:uncharacterized DUF497 family protein